MPFVVNMDIAVNFKRDQMNFPAGTQNSTSSY